MDELSPAQRGRESERNVKQALVDLRAEGVIRGFRKTRIYSKADRNGVDFYVFTEERRIPLQVKSSRAGRDNHMHYSYRTWIPCVVGQGAGLKERIKRLLNEYLRKPTHGYTAG